MLGMPVGFAILFRIIGDAPWAEPQGHFRAIFLGRKQEFWLHILPVQKLLKILSLLLQWLKTHPELKQRVLQSAVPQR